MGRHLMRATSFRHVRRSSDARHWYRARHRVAIQRAVVVMTLLLAQGLLACSASATGPQVSSVSPASGSVRGGERVTIYGSGFVGSRGACRSGYAVWFGTDLAHGYAISPTS